MLRCAHLTEEIFREQRQILLPFHKTKNPENMVTIAIPMRLTENRIRGTTMTGTLKTLPSLCFAAFLAARATAQTPTPKPRGAAIQHQTVIHFSDEKAILGMPASSSRSVTHCSSDGTTFLDHHAAGSTASELYSIEQDGTLKHFSRKLPPNFTHVSNLDFFAGEHTLVTLLKAELDDDTAGATAPRETDYFLSLSDHDGDSAELLPLELKFTPLKIALFGSGDYLVLGWDEGNLQPLLAILKSDGTIRRFVDLSDRLHSESFTSYNSMKEAESSPKERSSLASLQRVQFVPYGSYVLLTYPGTTKSILVLSSIGEDWVIPIAIPGGFVLHDALVSNEHSPLVLRVQADQDSARFARTAAPPRKLFEMDSYHGQFLRELIPDKPRVDDVTCAANSKLTAIFTDTVNQQTPTAAATNGQPAPAEAATQVVIATAPR